MSCIFISYKRVDKDKVFKIKDQIESALGEKCWIDLDGIESDAQFKNVIIKAINECEIVLFMYSKAHAKITDFEKDWTIRELHFADKKHKRIVFINLDRSPLTDAFEFDYGTKQHVDGTSSHDINKLVADISKWLQIEIDKGDTSENVEEKKQNNIIDFVYLHSNLIPSNETLKKSGIGCAVIICLLFLISLCSHRRSDYDIDGDKYIDTLCVDSVDCDSTFYLDIDTMAYASYPNDNSSAHNQPSATIDKIWLEHNAYDYDEDDNYVKGMRIHVKFSVYNMKGGRGRVVAYFHHSDDSKLLDINNFYCTSDGQVSVGVEYLSAYDASEWSDFTLFIPNSEIHVTSDMDYKIDIYIFKGLGNTSVKLCESPEWINFSKNQVDRMLLKSN